MQTNLEANKTVELLEKTIKVWKDNLEKKPDKLKIGPRSCPLCRQYYKNPSCKGCPVSDHTGKAVCGGTPIIRIGTVLATYQFKENSSQLLQEAIEAEIDFLENLLAIYKRTKTT